MDTKTLKFSLCIAGLLAFFQLSGQQIPLNQIDNHNHGESDISFIQNQNQWHPNVLYKANIGGINTVYLEEGAFTYVFSNNEDVGKVHDVMYASDSIRNAHVIRSHAYRVHFKNAKNASLEGLGKKGEYNNYILGNDPSKWASFVPLFKKINYQKIYDGINLEIYSSEGHFKYDFVIEAGADPNQILLDYEGTDGIDMDNSNLIIYTSVETIIEKQPYAYQIIEGKERAVNCQYVLNGNQVSFEFPDGYDKTKQLVIDPTVVAATLSGTFGAANFGHTATFDKGENIYTGGISFGIGYPTTSGAFQTSFNLGITDIAISKYNPDGSTLIFATYVGGNDVDFPYSMVTDFDQQLYILGSTESSNYPVTSNAVQQSKGGSADIVVTKLKSDGSGLVGSTYMGGSGSDGINTSYQPNGQQVNPFYNYGDKYRGEIIIDNQGNAYIATCSSSSNFPVTGGSFNTSFNNTGSGIYPALDGVVFKLNSDLSTLYWSTFVGENEPDIALGLRLDDYSNVYVTGVAGSSNFPTTTGTVQPNWNGGDEDGFIIKLSADGKNMLYGSFWGTSGIDHSYFMDVDEDGNVHIYGQTTGSMPITPNTYFYNANSRQFLASFTGDLSSTVYSTVVGTGNSQNLYDFVPVAFMVDKCNNIYFSGYFADFGLPTTPDAIENSPAPLSFYLGVLDPDATSLQYGTYYGNADHVDGGTSRFDKSGTVYQGVCSCVQSGTLNTLPNAHATFQSTFCDVGVFKIDFEVNTVTAAATALPTTSGCAPFTVNFKYTGQDATSLFWDFDDSGSTSTQTNPNHTFTTAGNYRVMQIATAPNTCNQKDTFFIDIVVFDGSSTSTELTVCNQTDPTYLDVTTTNATYQWQDGSTGATYTTMAAGIYWVDITIPGCTRRDTFKVNLSEPLNIDLGPDFSVCDQNTSTLDATTPGTVSYLWQDGSTNPVLSISSPGEYIVEGINSDGCPFTDAVNVLFGSTPTVSLEYVDTLCDWDTYTFDVTTPGLTYEWSDGSTNPTFTVTSPGDYWVIVSDNGCLASDTIQMNYYNQLIFAQNTFDVDCYEDCNGSIDVSASGGNGILNFLWNTGSSDTSLDDLCPGTYGLTITDDLCVYETSFFINEPAPLTFELSGVDVECFGDGNGSIEIINISGGTQPYSFSLNGGPLTSSSMFNGLSGGDYQVSVIDVNGCELSQMINLYEPQEVTVNAGPDFEIELGESKRIRATVFPNSGHYIEWSPVDSLDCVNCIQPIASPTSTTTYTITVIDSITGCLLTDEVVVSVDKNRNVFIPNAFSPNGDGSNDIFQIFSGIGVRKINKLKIFDRWGELVYSAENFLPNDSKTGWDGNFKGKPMNNAVFVYLVEIEFVDDIVIPYKGDITLLK
jgi:gliding motility-associated-like protein